MNSDTAFAELKEILIEEQYSAVLSDYQDDYIDHFEKAVCNINVSKQLSRAVRNMHV